MNRIEWLITTLALLMPAGFIFHGCKIITHGNLDFARDMAIAIYFFSMIVAVVIDTAVGRLNDTLTALGNR